jgi:hypothetical protein
MFRYALQAYLEVYLTTTIRGLNSLDVLLLFADQ